MRAARRRTIGPCRLDGQSLRHHFMLEYSRCQVEYSSVQGGAGSCWRQRLASLPPACDRRGGADILRDQGADPHEAAHYLIRLLFCLFAEDVGLLPNNAFAKLVDAFKDDPPQFTLAIGSLFGAMRAGGVFGYERILHFDGRLFDDDAAIPLGRNGLAVLARVSKPTVAPTPLYGEAVATYTEGTDGRASGTPGSWEGRSERPAAHNQRAPKAKRDAGQQQLMDG